MRLIGQRWEFQIGNTMVEVDNAYSWTLWGQERLLVNGEQVHASNGRMRFSQKYREPWLTPFGDGELKVWLRSTATQIRCSASLGSGLVDQSQKMTVAARAMADKKTVGHLS